MTIRTDTKGIVPITLKLFVGLKQKNTKVFPKICTVELPIK